MTTFFWIIEYIASFIEIFMCCVFCGTFLVKEEFGDRKYLAFAGAALSALLITGLNKIEIFSVFNSIFVLFVIILFQLFLYKAKIGLCIVLPLIYAVILTAIDFAVSYFTALILQVDANYLLNHQNFSRVLCILLSKFLLILIVVILRRLLGKSITFVKKYIVIMCMYSAFLLVSLFIMVGLNIKNRSPETEMFLVLFFIISILIELLVLYFIMKAGESYEQQRKNELIKMIMELIPKRLIDNVDRHEDADFVYHVGEERYRVNIYYEQTNICAAIRVINDEILTLEQLEMPTVLNQIAMEPRGLVLVTGPTGSGKSTTLAAMIDLVNKQRNCHILTIEDPIEYVYKQKQALIHQREIGEDVKDFDMALRSAMREDPDVILVGEMRDYETISAVITLAETGHLVFSTLHTIGAAKTIDRIIDIFPQHKQAQVRTQLSGVLNAVITQTLLPHASGIGRVAAVEIMRANDAVRNLIRDNKGHQINSVIQTGKKEGMISLNHALANLVREGKITLDTAKKCASDISEFKQYLQ